MTQPTPPRPARPGHIWAYGETTNSWTEIPLTNDKGPHTIVCSGNFDVGNNETLNCIGSTLDDWDRLSNDERGQIRAIAPQFVEALEQLRTKMDRS